MVTRPHGPSVRYGMARPCRHGQPARYGACPHVPLPQTAQEPPFGPRWPVPPNALNPKPKFQHLQTLTPVRGSGYVRTYLHVLDIQARVHPLHGPGLPPDPLPALSIRLVQSRPNKSTSCPHIELDQGPGAIFEVILELGSAQGVGLGPGNRFSSGRAGPQQGGYMRRNSRQQ